MLCRARSLCRSAAAGAPRAASVLARETRRERVVEYRSLDGRLEPRAVPRSNLDLADAALKVFLPFGYPHSVPPQYKPYTQWAVTASVASTASGVLSTQAMLFAVGLGAGSIPIAAALNWIIKDGIGQLGGVLFASHVHSSFDSDPKRWRMVSALAQDAAALLEALTPLVPHLFLPLAAVANVGKNVSWMCASASRAAIHRSFVRRHNLGDITAKATSQSIAASLAGTALGVGISAVVGGGATPAVLSAFAALSATHLFSVRRSVSAVILTSLNEQRLCIVARAFLATGAVPSPSEVARQELLLPTQRVRPCVPLHELVASPAELEAVTTPGSRFLVSGAAFALLEGATSSDVLRAWLASSASLTPAHPHTDGDEFEAALEAAGWAVDAVALEGDDGRRVSLGSS